MMVSWIGQFYLQQFRSIKCCCLNLDPPLHPHPMKTNELVVSVTGFDVGSQQSSHSLTDLKTMIQFLNMRFASTLSEETTILIAKTTLTEKYKIAKIYSRPIVCLKVDWLIDSYAKNDILPTKHYEIHELFFGVEAVLVEMGRERLARVKRGLEENGARVKVIESIRQFVQKAASGDFRLVVTEEEHTAKLLQVFPDVNYPIVGTDWFQDSVKRSLCKFPEDYALNYCYLRKKPIEGHTQRMKAKLNFSLSRGTKHAVGNMFQHLFVYFHSSVPAELAQSLKHLVTVNGGYYLEEFSLAATHTLTDFITQQELMEIRQYGLLTQVVRVEWLIDCIYLNRRIREEDYCIRSHRPRQQLKVVLRRDQGSNPALQTGYSKKSISLSTLSVSSKGNRRKRRIEGFLFKGYSFYLQSSHRRDIELLSLSQDIIKNGGHVFTSRTQINSTSCYYVLRDCPDWGHLLAKLTQTTKEKVKIVPVSHRWVRECIAKASLIGLKVENYIYQPFPFPTPINGFHKMVFLVIGLDAVLKLRLKQLYNALGSVRNTPNRNQITHCLCGPNSEELDKFRELFRDNVKVVFLKYEWLLECGRVGEVVPLESYCHRGHIVRDVALTVNDSRDIHRDEDENENGEDE